jgi:hypothetical protein
MPGVMHAASRSSCVLLPHNQNLNITHHCSPLRSTPLHSTPLHGTALRCAELHAARCTYHRPQVHGGSGEGEVDGEVEHRAKLEPCATCVPCVPRVWNMCHACHSCHVCVMCAMCAMCVACVPCVPWAVTKTETATCECTSIKCLFVERREYTSIQCLTANINTMHACQ